MNNIKIIKANGVEALFKIEKLIASLKNAGAAQEVATNIAADIESIIFDGMTTREIYKKAFDRLRKHSRPTAARYKLKKAIMELGETGYPFEKFIGELFKAEGFQVKVGVVVQGKCVTHEVDVIAEMKSKHYMCECKFHNRQGRHCDVKIPLYIQSRFKDVEQAWKEKSGHENKFHQGWIITNTRFTSDATQYAECSGLQLISWDYPNGNAIRDRINKYGVHPITCLTTLTKKEKNYLVSKGVVTCKLLCNQPKMLSYLNISEKRKKQILLEGKAVCTKQNINPSQI